MQLENTPILMVALTPLSIATNMAVFGLLSLGVAGGIYDELGEDEGWRNRIAIFVGSVSAVILIAAWLSLLRSFLMFP